jgi:hypothetical protein
MLAGRARPRTVARGILIIAWTPIAAKGRAPRFAGHRRYPAPSRQPSRRRGGGRVSPPSCREPCGLPPTKPWSPRTGLTLRSSWEPSPPRREASSFSPAVPPTCHKQRYLAVCSGQPRSLEGSRWAGRWSLTWGGGVARTCMACKGSDRRGSRRSAGRHRSGLRAWIDRGLRKHFVVGTPMKLLT